MSAAASPMNKLTPEHQYIAAAMTVVFGELNGTMLLSEVKDEAPVRKTNATIKALINPLHISTADVSKSTTESRKMKMEYCIFGVVPRPTYVEALTATADIAMLVLHLLEMRATIQDNIINRIRYDLMLEFLFNCIAVHKSKVPLVVDQQIEALVRTLTVKSRLIETQVGIFMQPLDDGLAARFNPDTDKELIMQVRMILMARHLTTANVFPFDKTSAAKSIEYLQTSWMNLPDHNRRELLDTIMQEENHQKQDQQWQQLKQQQDEIQKWKQLQQEKQEEEDNNELHGGMQLLQSPVYTQSEQPEDIGISAPPSLSPVQSDAAAAAAETGPFSIANYQLLPLTPAPAAAAAYVPPVDFDEDEDEALRIISAELIANRQAAAVAAALQIANEQHQIQMNEERARAIAALESSRQRDLADHNYREQLEAERLREVQELKGALKKIEQDRVKRTQSAEAKVQEAARIVADADATIADLNAKVIQRTNSGEAAKAELARIKEANAKAEAEAKLLQARLQEAEAEKQAAIELATRNQKELAEKEEMAVYEANSVKAAAFEKTLKAQKVDTTNEWESLMCEHPYLRRFFDGGRFWDLGQYYDLNRGDTDDTRSKIVSCVSAHVNLHKDIDLVMIYRHHKNEDVPAVYTRVMNDPDDQDSDDFHALSELIDTEFKSACWETFFTRRPGKNKPWTREFAEQCELTHELKEMWRITVLVNGTESVAVSIGIDILADIVEAQIDTAWKTVQDKLAKERQDELDQENAERRREEQRQLEIEQNAERDRKEAQEAITNGITSSIAPILEAAAAAAAINASELARMHKTFVPALQASAAEVARMKKIQAASAESIRNMQQQLHDAKVAADKKDQERIKKEASDKRRLEEEAAAAAAAAAAEKKRIEEEAAAAAAAAAEKKRIEDETPTPMHLDAKAARLRVTKCHNCGATSKGFNGTGIAASVCGCPGVYYCCAPNKRHESECSKLDHSHVCRQ